MATRKPTRKFLQPSHPHSYPHPRTSHQNQVNTHRYIGSSIILIKMGTSKIQEMGLVSRSTHKTSTHKIIQVKGTRNKVIQKILFRPGTQKNLPRIGTHKIYRGNTNSLLKGTKRYLYKIGTHKKTIPWA